jgi:hypothetical protein
MTIEGVAILVAQTLPAEPITSTHGTRVPLLGRLIESSTWLPTFSGPS